jgi:hypothetical protein
MGSGCRVIGVIGVTAAYCPVQENGASGRQVAGETDNKWEQGVGKRQFSSPDTSGDSDLNAERAK